MASPNPFSDRIRLSFRVSQNQRVNFSVYDTRGIRIAQLYEGEKDKQYDFEFSSNSLINGLDMATLATEKEKARYKNITLAK